MDQENEQFKYKRPYHPLPEPDPEIQELFKRSEKMRLKLKEQVEDLEKYENLVPEVYRPFLKELNPKQITSRKFRENYEGQRQQLIVKLQEALGTGKIEGLESSDAAKKKESGLRRHRLKGRRGGWISMD